MIAPALAAILAVLAPAPETVLPLQAQPYQSASAGSLSEQDRALFAQGLAAARARDVTRTREITSQISDATARKIIEWALIDTSADRLAYADLAAADTTFAGWPRAESRRTATEIALDRSGAGPDSALALFTTRQPTTVQGAFALTDALEQRGRGDEARSLIRGWWRDRSFDAATQTRILNRWGAWFTQDDHDTRAAMLLLGTHGPATRAMVQLASPDVRAVGNAVLALRTAYSAETIVAGLTPAQAMHPAVVLERVRIARARGQVSVGYPLLAALPAAPSHADGQKTLWDERRGYFITALQDRNWQAAYDAMAGHGFPSGDRKVDAEFFAGWVALTKLNDPERAARHFETLRTTSSTPITQGRAFYWLGRAAEARGDQAAAQSFYAGGARHIQTFYGQLAAEKTGQTTMTLPLDPEIKAEDTARFESNEVVQAARILGAANELTLLRVFAYQLDDDLPQAADLAQLMDLTREYGEGFTAMMVGRAASQRGFLMPGRQYPIRIPPTLSGAAPLEFTLAITRQESSFDPRARSHANARGMMQFIPATGRAVARQIGMSYSDDRLWEPDYNMTLGSYHLGDLTNRFGGSMLLTTVGYNAGPARPPQWIARCGDPRAGSASNVVDAVDFIECAPFTETRNYMMRVMENMQIYRARLNGGTAPLQLSSDIARGAARDSGPQPYMFVGEGEVTPEPEVTE
jgi:soluble lytic murein transglycosylase